MKKYSVSLMEHCDLGNGMGEWLEPIIFECEADDFGHAQEQAENAYEYCIVLSIKCDSY